MAIYLTLSQTELLSLSLCLTFRVFHTTFLFPLSSLPTQTEDAEEDLSESVCLSSSVCDYFCPVSFTTYKKSPSDTQTHLLTHSQRLTAGDSVTLRGRGSNVGEV